VLERRRIKRQRDGSFALRLPDPERDILRQLPAELKQLLDSDDDPSLRRLFPPAYTDDVVKDAEYQMLMRRELLERHRASLDVVERTVDAEVLSEDELWAWMAALNQLRLVLGTRLDVTEDMAEPSSDDPTAPAYALYAYLSFLQDQVVSALSGS
jgi:hypothetical protein